MALNLVEKRIDNLLQMLRKRFLIHWQEGYTGDLIFKIRMNDGGVVRCREGSDKELKFE